MTLSLVVFLATTPWFLGYADVFWSAIEVQMEAQRYGVAVNAISPLAMSRMTADVFGSRATNQIVLTSSSRSEVPVKWRFSMMS